MTTLLLWDIDGTLVSSGGAGMRALRAGLEKAFGINGLVDDIDYAGRTDRWIIQQIFAKFNLPDSEENAARYLDAYLEALPAALAGSSASVLPGVRPRLAEVAARGDVAQGLLTGNIRRGAEVKLSFHDLWRYFPFGAFADDAALRNELGPHALRRARARFGVDFAPERVWIIGDTPHDIACARAIGASALAVATGQYTSADLAAHHPTALLPNLSDPTAFWSAIESPNS